MFWRLCALTDRKQRWITDYAYLVRPRRDINLGNDFIDTFAYKGNAVMASENSLVRSDVFFSVRGARFQSLLQRNAIGPYHRLHAVVLDRWFGLKICQ